MTIATATHTPGPWIVDRDMRGIGNAPVIGVVTSDHRAVANCGTYGEANARLIAAAPELLAALRELADIGEAGVIERRETGKPTWGALDAIQTIARAAIAKATGRA